MNHKKWLTSLGVHFALLMMLFLLDSPLHAQTFGSVTGTVTDPTGAVVPGATVTIVDVGTNDTRTAQTNGSGEYRFLDLTPSNYKVDVVAKSFKSYEQQAVMVTVGSAIRVDAVLQVGASTEIVEVNTQPPLLQTESGSVTSEVEGKTVEEMPLNGRNVMNLLAITPGVIGGTNTAGAPELNAGNHTTVTGFSNYSIAGGQNGYASDYIDGAPDNVLGQNTVALIPTQDATQEFQISSNAVSAEYGRFGGGIVAMATKSGSNAFHGSAYEYLRNTVLNANYFFTKNSGLPRAKWNQNQYGVSVTGPIKRDKAFFMFTWEDYSLRTATPVTTNVPGDGKFGTTNQAGYSAGSTTGGVAPATFAMKIADPTGRCPITNNGLAQGAGGLWTIPVSCFDPTSVVLLGYFARPNSSANSSFNFVSSPVVGTDNHQYNGRMDYNLSNKQRVFARYTYWGFNDIAQNAFKKVTPAPPLDSTYGGTHLFSHQAVLGDTYTVNSTTIADVRLSYTRQTLDNYNASTYNSTSEAQFGPAYAAMAGLLTFKSPPTISTGGGNDNLYGVTAHGAVQIDKYDLYTINANVTKILGNHAFKFGGEARLGQFNSVANYPEYAGQAAFTATNTGVGDDVAALLLGYFGTDTISAVIPTTSFNYSFALYGTDSWKIGRDLTVNLGLRSEMPGGMEEKHDRSSVLLPTALDPGTGLPGMVALVNSSLHPSRAIEPIHHDLFSPRISFAERLGDKSVLRGGYGLVYLSPDLSGGVLPQYASPFVATLTTSTNNAASLAAAGSNPNSVIARESNPFPNGFLQPVGRSNSDLTKNLVGSTLTGAVPSTKYPYVQQFNLALSRQWKGGWLTEVAGVVVKGTKLPVNANNGTPPSSAFELNQIPDGDYSPSTGLVTVGPDTGTLITGKASAPSAACAAYAAATNAAATAGQCLRPFPQFADVQDWSHFTASSIYDALYATVQKRFGAGGTLNGNYVWFKSIDDVSGYQDWYATRTARGLSSFDIPQRAVISYVLDLPFGKGQRWAHFGGVGGALVSGWAVNGITSFQSGAALGFSTNGGNKLSQSNQLWLFNSAETAASSIRANLVPGCNLKEPGSVWSKYIAGLSKSSTAYFNSSCVSAAAAYGFGNAPKLSGNLRAQGVDNFDFSLVKGTTIKEKADLQFRLEAFNLFNRMQFGAPSAAVGNKNYNVITTQANNPRLIQASLRLKF